MKKLSLILALIMALSLTSCGDDSKKDKDDKKTVSVSDIFAKKDKSKDKDKDKYDDDDDFDDDKDDVDFDDDDEDNEKTTVSKPNKQTSVEIAVDKNESKSNKNYKVLKEGKLQTPVFEVPEVGKFTIKSYKIVSPNYAKDERFIMYEGTFTNLSEYDTSMGSFLNYMNFYQNGIMLSRIAFEERDVFTPVLTNANIDVVITYMLRDETTPNEIRWGEYSDNRQSYTIEI